MSQEKTPDLIGTSAAISAITQAFEQVTTKMTISLPNKKRKLTRQSHRTPKTSPSRLEAPALHHATVLYLAYGSNLAAETFLGKRGIKPLSQVNVVAPAISLTFNLPGIPYFEPCFANTRYRSTSKDTPDDDRPPYHKNAWKKGLVGVVYEVTQADYEHIVATEGGGASYHDVLTDCYPLSGNPDEEVPAEPINKPFKAHTLYAAATTLRPDEDYAQPSPRYLKLLTDGAEEHNLPKEYRHFLKNIRTYHTTTTSQQLGAYIYLSIWGTLIFFFFGAGKIFLRPDGTYPKWFAQMIAAVFTGAWASYDSFFKKTFGDGERTIGDEITLARTKSNSARSTLFTEKTALLANQQERVYDHV